MKRESLLFILLIALLAPLAMNGQTSLLSENFDNMSSISTSYSGTGWFAYNAGSGNNWTLNSSSSYAHSGSKSAQYMFNSSYAANCYLVSAPFSVSSSMTELSVSLYEAVRSDSYQETFDVFFVKASDVTSAASVASATHYSAIASASYTNTTFAQKTGTVTNSALAGQSVRVVVHCTSIADRWYLYIDDITVMETTSGGGGQGGDDDGCAEIGTVVSGQTDYTYGPVNDYYNYSYYQIIYPKAEVPTGNITSIGFNYAHTSAMTKKTDVTIYMGTTSSNVSDSWVNVGTMTKVYTGNLNCTQQGWNDFTLTTPYAYTGAQNLIVVIMDKSGGYDGSAYKFNYAEGSNAVNKYAYADNSSYITFPANDAGTPTTTSATNGNVARYPVTRFCAEASTSCPTPTGLTINNITNNSASVAWDVESGISYEVQYAEITAAAPLTNGSWLQYDNGTYGGSIGNGNNQYDWTWGVMYPTSMLNGKTVLSKVSIYERSGSNYNSGNIKIEIYSGGTSAPQTLIYTETVSPSGSTGFHEVTLASPVTIDPTQNLWIALTEYGKYVMPYCSSSETNNQWVENDGWMNIADLNASFSSYGWMIRGFIQEIDLSNLTGWQSLDSPYNLTGLNAETQYAVRVRANCDEDGESAWAYTSFITLSNCATPYNLTSSNTTANSATLNWLGAQEEYDVNIKKVLFFEDFEGGAIPSGWTTLSNSNDSYNWYYDNSYSQAHSGSGVMSSASSVSNGTSWNDFTPDHWLVTPQLDLQGTMSVWVRSQQTNASYYQEHFAIYLSLTNGSTISDFTITLVPENVTTTEYIEYTADLSQYIGQQGYIAIRHFNCNGQFRMNIDDFGIFDDIHTVPATTVPFTIDQLEPVSDYMWQVQGVDCDGNGGTTDWSEVATFTTTNQFVKHIIGYNSEEGNGSGNYYLIASPIGQVAPTNVTNMVNSNHTGYDLFYFDQSQDLEWITYKPSGTVAPLFNLVSGKGYLYANSQTVDLVFNGSNGNYVTNGEVTISLDYVDTAPNNGTYNIDLPGWNLVGNPFAVTAYPNRSFYTMDSDGSAFVGEVTSGSIEAMEGIFVEATGTGQSVTFSTTDPNAKSPTLALNLINTTTGSSHIIDRAIVRFDQGDQLHKFQLFKNSTKVYIPKEGQDYAIVCSEEIGEMPVNFKAEDNGTYTLNLSVDNVEFGYLHLIDNMTGMDIDLLQTPSYTFEAKTTDYESRFKLVFATGNNSKDDNFAYFSNGSFVINNDGEATLQVIDIMGRILKSENINGCANLNVNAAPGVYMLRLVNGDNVKVQKVVVK